MILILKHIDIEGPGTLGEYFQERAYKPKHIDLGRGEALVSELSNVAAVIVMGGPMNVYEEDKYPWLKAENIFIQNVLKEKIPYLGICLGAQLLAKACQAPVVKSPMKEVGWFKVFIEKSDPLFAGLDKTMEVYHWHEDMFSIPGQGERLATAPACPNQAFKVGGNAYGLQFHVEITRGMIESWCRSYFKSNDREKQNKAKQMLETYDQKKDIFNRQAKTVYRNFEKLMMEKIE